MSSIYQAGASKRVILVQGKIEHWVNYLPSAGEWVLTFTGPAPWTSFFFFLTCLYALIPAEMSPQFSFIFEAKTWPPRSFLFWSFNGERKEMTKGGKGPRGQEELGRYWASKEVSQARQGDERLWDDTRSRGRLLTKGQRECVCSNLRTS